MSKTPAHVRRYNKLVRDKIPALIEAQNHQAIVTILQDQEYWIELRKKLAEEMLEYQHDKTVEELADILEVVYALARMHGLTTQELEEVRKQKAESKGAFDKRIFLKHVIVPQTH